MLTPNTRSLPRPVVTSFRSAFPVELLEHIVSFADRATVANFAQASFASLQLFAPKVLADVVVAHDLSELYRDMHSLFATRVSPDKKGGSG